MLFHLTPYTLHQHGLDRTQNTIYSSLLLTVELTMKNVWSRYSCKVYELKTKD